MLAKKIFSFSLFTLISRIFGYTRDILLANKLGTGLLNDAFIVAFRLPNLFRSIFAEGALNNSFVPIYSSQSDPGVAAKFAANIRNLLFIALLFLTLIIEIFMPQVVLVIAPGLTQNAEQMANAVLFSRITFGYIFFISLTALYGSIMNARGKFIPFASAPILLNISIIACLFYSDLFQNAAKAASYGILAAGVLQLLWVLFFMKIYHIKLPFGGFKLLPESKTMFKRMVPIIIASGFIQINLLIDNIFASLQEGALSYLYFASRLNQLPLSLIGISMGVVILPTLAKRFKDNKKQALNAQSRAIQFALYLTIPAAFALFFLSSDIIKVLLQYGEFDEFSTAQTSKALAAYSVGLLGWVLQKIILSNFHARGDTMYPLKASIAAILLNIALNALLFYLLGFVGVALASSIAVYFNLGLLCSKAYKTQFIAVDSWIYRILFKSILATIVMIIAVKSMIYYLPNHALFTLGSMGAGLVIYIAITLILKINPIKMVG